MAAYSKYPRCRDCGSEDAPHICGSSQHWEGPSGGAGGGGDGHVYKIDKIIQITVSDGKIWGLSESGVLYRMYASNGYEKIWERVTNSPRDMT